MGDQLTGGLAFEDVSAELLCSVHAMLVVETLHPFLPSLDVELVDLA